jgi:predicted XRE-type DNA-binding protein
MVSKNLAPEKRSTTVLMLRHSLYIGIQARVAKKLNVHESVVCRVANGKTTSKRISRALQQELQRIEREIERRTERAA